MRSIKQLYLFLVYFAINSYPLYLLLEAGLNTPSLAQRIIVLSLTIIWFIGVYRISPHILIIYYVLTGTILIASGNTLITPQLIIMFTLLVFLADYVSRLLLGYKWRRIHGGIVGIASTVIIPLTVLGIYVYISYIIAGSINYFVEEVVANTPLLFQSFFKLFISSRIGSLVLFMLIAFVIYYILSEYITNTLSDTLLLSPSFALHRVISWTREELVKLIEGNSDFQKLFSRSVFLIIGFYIYILLFPLYGLFINAMSRIPVFGYIVSFGTWFLLSFLIYSVVRSRLFGMPRYRGVTGVRVSKLSLIISMIILSSYVILLYVEGLPVDQVLFRSLGLSGRGLQYLTFRDFVSRTYFQLSINYSYYSQLYIDKLVEAYQLLSKVFEYIIKFLWG